MTLFEIASVLWQRGENEAYNALIEYIREHDTVVECGPTLLSKSIAKQTDIRWRIQKGLDSAFESDSPLLNLGVWEEAERRGARKDLDDAERERLTWSTYTYLLSGDEEAELQLDDDRRAEAHMRASERDSPHSFGFDALVESIYKQLCEEGWHAA